jgi:hypothetical protein
MDGFCFVHAQKAPPGEDAEEPGKEKEERGRTESAFDLFHSSLDQEEAKEKKRQDEGGPCLAPYFLLADDIPEEMEAQVKDDKMVEEPRHNH